MWGCLYREPHQQWELRPEGSKNLVNIAPKIPLNADLEEFLPF